MGLLSKMLGGRGGEVAINQTLRDAISVVPGVSGHDVSYQHGPAGAAQPGRVSGVAQVRDAEALAQVLRTAYRVLIGLLGDHAHDVVFDITGQTPEGTVTPRDLGLTQPPGGREVGVRLAL